MKKLKVSDEETLSAAKIVKEIDKITGYDENGIVLFSIKGINNFAAFSLLNNAEWDAPEISESTTIQELKNRQDESENAILSLMDMSLMGGI